MKTRERVYQAICRSFEEKGYAPTIREICAALGGKSTATVFYHLQTLAEEGRIVLLPETSGRRIALPPGSGAHTRIFIGPAVRLPERIAMGGRVD